MKESLIYVRVVLGVVKEYKDMVEEITTGPCIALEIRSDKDTAIAFREKVGPADPVSI